jgi:DNA polymerase III delta prime subunit
VSDLTSIGSYRKADNGQLYFVTEAEAIHIHDEEPKLQILLVKEFGVNANSKIFDYILTAMQNEAFSKGQQVTVAAFSYINPDTRTVYISLMDGKRMVKITGNLQADPLKIEKNGCDGIWFLDRPEWEPWIPTYDIEYLSDEDGREVEVPHMPDGYVSRLLIEPINFAATEGLSLEESRWLYHQWIRCAMLNLTEKMHLLLTGEPGGGKSMAGELLKKAFFGSKAKVDDITKEPDFEAAVVGSSLTVLDNQDDCYQSWLINKLCVVATGTAFVKRELYKTLNQVTFDARSWIMMTSTDSRFIDNRRTLADRTLTLRVGRIADGQFRVREGFHAAVAKSRDKILTELCHDIDQMVNTWRLEKETPRSELRLASVGVTMKRFARADEQEKADAIFKKLKGVQKQVVLDNHPVVLTLQERFSRFRDQTNWKATAADMAMFAEESGISKLKAVGFGRKVREIEAYLKVEYAMSEHTPRGGSPVFTFTRPQ